VVEELIVLHQVGIKDIDNYENIILDKKYNLFILISNHRVEGGSS
jgi:hypothetical protein